MINRKSTRAISLQSSALVLLAGMSTALVVVDAQNMLVGALKKIRIVREHRLHQAAPRRLPVGCGAEDYQTLPHHTSSSLWIG
jgi:hypothetical protein